MFKYSDLANIDLATLTSAWNRCWQGYYYETHFTETQMKTWLERCQVDLTHSTSLRHFERIVGFSLLGVENQMGWIAGTCIDPENRGSGLFAPLLQNQLEKAKNLYIQQVRLEVLNQNFAHKVYEKVGFRKIRELYVYRYPKDAIEFKGFRSVGFSLRETNQTDYFQARREAGFNPPWQRREEYLKRHNLSSAWLSFDGKSGMLITKDSHLLLDAWTVAWDQTEKLLSSILALTQGEFILTNQPKDLFTAYLCQLGINPSDIQYEMTRTINQL